MALVKHNNNSISAVTSMASLSTGSMTLIKEVTASSDASISFVDGSSDVVLDSTYPIYKFEFINIHASTDNSSAQEFKFNMSTDGGSNYVSSGYDWMYDYYDCSGSAWEYASSNNSNMEIQRFNGNQARENTNGFLWLYNALNSTKYTFSHSHPAYLSEHGRLAHYSGGATYPVAAQVSAIKFMPQSGNFTTAQGISLYGLKEY